MYNKCAKYTPWAIKNVTLLVFYNYDKCRPFNNLITLIPAHLQFIAE